MMKILRKNFEKKKFKIFFFNFFFFKKIFLRIFIISSIAFFKSLQSGLPINLINTPMSRVSCRSPDYKDLKNAMEEVNFWSTWFTPGFLIFGRNLLQDEIVLMLIQGTIPSKAFYLLHSIIRKPGKTTCYIAISNSAFPCGSKPYVFEKVSNHLHIDRLP